MAQTKRKRRTKHRGNAAGKVEARGRTGRASTAAERKQTARGGRVDRRDKPPSWRGAANRSAIATVLFVVAVAILQKNVVPALIIGIIMFFVYTALGFYTDSFVYKRRQARRAAGKL